jgi:Zn-dependent protease
VFDKLLLLVPLILSLSVHEWAHAWSALKLGDDTAAKAGRLTLDPTAHLDLVGTVLLPLLGIPFGWAKPVPVDPSRFRPDVHPRTGMMITAVAGPLSNLLLALVLLVVIAVAVVALPHGVVPLRLLETALALNVGLALFNLLPIPPLDGSRVVAGLLPEAAMPAWRAFAGLAPLLLIAVIVLPRQLDVGLFDAPLRWAFQALDGLITLLEAW